MPEVRGAGRNEIENPDRGRKLRRANGLGPRLRKGGVTGGVGSEGSKGTPSPQTENCPESDRRNAATVGSARTDSNRLARTPSRPDARLRADKRLPSRNGSQSQAETVGHTRKLNGRTPARAKGQPQSGPGYRQGRTAARLAEGCRTARGWTARKGGCWRMPANAPQTVRSGFP
jgi:hypothetical protein